MLAENLRDNSKVAIKIIKDSKGDDRSRDQVRREIEILRFLNKVDHDKGFIVKL